MAPLALLLLLGTVPTVSLDRDSSCAPLEVLRVELASVAVQFVKDAPLVLRLELDGRLTLRREGKLVLSRSLGAGTCEELGRAAAVVVGRWIKELQRAEVGPRPVAETKPAPTEPKVTPSVTKPAIAVVETKPAVVTKSTVVETKPAVVETKPAVVEPMRVVETKPAVVETKPAVVESRPAVAEPKPPPRETARDVVAAIGTSPPTTVLPLTPTLSPEGEREKVDERVYVTHLEVLAGGGLTVPGAPSVNPIISLDLALVLNQRLRIDLAGLFDFGGSVNVRDEAGLPRGELTTRGGVILPGAGYCVLEPLRVCLGAVAGLRILEGESSGSFVFQSATRQVARFVFGPNAQLALIRGPFHVALDLSLLVTPDAPTFKVTDLEPTLPFPIVQGLFRLSVGWGTSQ